MRSAVRGLGVRGHYLRRRLKGGRAAYFLAALSLAVIVMATLIYRFGGIEPIALLDALAVAALTASLVLLFGLASLLVAWFTGAEGGGPMASAVAVSVLALLPFGLGAYLASANPRANVAFTQGLAPDPVSAMIDRPQTGDVPTLLDRVLVGGERPAPVAGRQFLAPAARVFEASREVLQVSGWEIESVEAVELEDEVPEGEPELSQPPVIPIPQFRADLEDEPADPLALPESGAYRILAIAEDPIFGLPSDIEIFIGEEGRESFVEMRSVSRATPIDLGQNRRYVEAFMEGIEAAMAGREMFAPGG